MKIEKYTGPHTSYSEVHQTNVLRWTVLFNQGDGVFKPQTKEFKCKDFFNELVAKYHGHVLGCYGFTTESIELQDEGVWVLITHIINKEAYEANVGSINKLSAAEGLPPIKLEWHTPKSCVALLPREYFKNTYLISFLTYLMRVANVDEVVTDPTWRKHPTLNIDCPFRNVFDKVMDRGFKSPDIKSYYYAGKKNDYSVKPYVSNVHNNGVASWTALMMAEGIA